MWINKSIQDIGHGPKILKQTAQECIKKHQNILYQAQFYLNETPTSELNIADLQTILIQITGRFCERYASDLLLTLADIEPFTKQAVVTDNSTWSIGIGIRENGVDHNNFILARLNETKRHGSNLIYPTTVYRKLLVLQIEDTKDENYDTRKFTLADITHQLTRLSDTD